MPNAATIWKLHQTLGDVVRQLNRAIRYIEVNTAYVGAMTAEQVEKAIRYNNGENSTGAVTSEVQINANSVAPLASFNFVEAREAVRRANELTTCVPSEEKESRDAFEQFVYMEFCKAMVGVRKSPDDLESFTSYTRRNPQGHYARENVEMLWAAWQAARKP